MFKKMLNRCQYQYQFCLHHCGPLGGMYPGAHFQLVGQHHQLHAEPEEYEQHCVTSGTQQN